MLKIYLTGAAGVLLFGQSGASQTGAAQTGGGATGQQLLDQALAADPSMGTIMAEAGKIASLGIQPTDAAVIVAGSGLLWKFLDVQQKGGTIDTFNLWLRRKLKVDNPPPPAKP
jgi:hypothetical protein